MNYEDLIPMAAELLDRCRADGVRLTTAESCTGGLIAACLTEVAGSSDVLDRGFVTYSNEAKTEQLRVPAALLEQYGAVSIQVARAMANGAIEQSGSDLGVAVTGIAGPGGATPGKPVGLVYIAAVLGGGEVHAERHLFAGDRKEVRRAAVQAALTLCNSVLRTDTH